ncbi:MAG: heavy metal-responsive transcriptional regulator [Acidobacteriota bacterium]|nr:heavy metal-responsive transcriptional regulator [Acidobacteriota bacterium]
MQIGELAHRAGATVQTVRFYERQNLLPQPARTESGFRRYGDQELKQLQFIRQAKWLGFTLGEIREIIQSRGRGECPCNDVIAIAERHLRDVTEQIQKLENFKQELDRSIKQWKKAGKQKLSAGAICTLIERTMEPGRTRRNDK